MAGRAPVTNVQVSTDGGLTWGEATLKQDAHHPWAWRGWTYAWDAVPGQYELLARATDADGGTQPLEQEWNAQGMANNLIQRIPVTVLV